MKPLLLLALLLPLLVHGATQTRLLRVEVETLVSGLEHPWGLDFLPDGRLLVSERPGRLRTVQDGKLGPPIAGLPPIAAVGQGGLLDVAVHQGWIYFSYATPDSLSNTTAVARARLVGNRLTDLQSLFVQRPRVLSRAHFGSRLAFSPDGHLFITLGERFIRADDAQRLDNHLGKVVRIWPDGRIPGDNPFRGQAGALPEIWSYGHRNIQGAAIHPATGQLWIHEHGPQGGDELNLIRPGRNYGWPVITYGEQYGGGKIGLGTHHPGMEQPLYQWTPSIAPSGLIFYTGEAFAPWQGNLLLGSLVFGELVRLELDGNRVVEAERLLGKVIGQRVRDVAQGPDGLVYLLTDTPQGRIVRLRPAGS